MTSWLMSMYNIYQINLHIVHTIVTTRDRHAKDLSETAKFNMTFGVCNSSCYWMIIIKFADLLKSLRFLVPTLCKFFFNFFLTSILIVLKENCIE